MRRIFVLNVAAIVALSSPASAAAIGYTVRTAGDLASLCAGGPGGAEREGAINFCLGYAQGVLELVRDHEAKSICLPDKPPSRVQTMAQFVAWSKSKEDRAAGPAARAVENFFKERFPCNK